MKLLKLAGRSLGNRRLTTILTVMAIATSVALLFTIERIRSGARKSFESTVYGVDLIVGARTSPINLLLYSVFHLGDPVNNISAETYLHFAAHPEVEQAIPISTGDSFYGFRVIGTTNTYFDFWRYGDNRRLTFQQGKMFETLLDVVLGHEVARKLGKKIGDRVVLSHGVGEVSFKVHDDMPFEVSGILAATRTPADRSVFISLQAITALHLENKKKLEQELPLPDITAFMVRMKSKFAIFNLQREINDYSQEAVTAIMPGMSLRSLWQTIGIAEKSFLLLSFLVFIISLLGMTGSLLATLSERRREMAILRSVGAGAGFIFSLLIVEAMLLSLAGIIAGILFLYGSLFAFQPLLVKNFGLTAGLFTPSYKELFFLLAIMLCSLLAGAIPAWQAYRNSLTDGLMFRI